MLSREWRCSWSSPNRRCSNYIWVIKNLIAYLSASYVRDLTLFCTIAMRIKYNAVGYHRLENIQFWSFEVDEWFCNVDISLNDRWVRSRNCGCLVTWFCYQLIAKPGNKTAAVLWPDPYDVLFLPFYWYDYYIVTYNIMLWYPALVITCVAPYHNIELGQHWLR